VSKDNLTTPAKPHTACRKKTLCGLADGAARTYTLRNLEQRST